MVFEPGRHEPLLETEWDAARANEANRAIAADLEETLGSGIVWPVHPLDREEEPQTENKSLYLGASGTLWAMWYLEREGAAGFRIKPSDLIGRVYQSYLAEPDTGDVVPSYYLGEAGILLVLWRLTRSHGAADRLFASIERNIPNPTNEAFGLRPAPWSRRGTCLSGPASVAGTICFSRMQNDSGRPGDPVKTLPAIYRRTGNSIWLERARSLAAHAIAQGERMRQQHRRGRYTLWTGDPGLAVYIWHCLRGSGGMPGLDILD